jgi:hypothetical protein
MIGPAPTTTSATSGGVMLGRKRAATVDHEQVVSAVEGLIRSGGLLSVTRPALAAALGVPVAALDVDIDAVLAETYRALTVAEVAEVRRTVLANPSPVEQLRALLGWLATPPEDSDAVRLEAWALSRRNPALRDAARDSPPR